MANKISIQVNDKGDVSYDLDVDNSMTMLIALVDAMNHSEELANLIDAASETRVTIRKSQEKALEDKVDEDQIDMFNEVKNKL